MLYSWPTLTLLSTVFSTTIAQAEIVALSADQCFHILKGILNASSVIFRCIPHSHTIGPTGKGHINLYDF